MPERDQNSSSDLDPLQKLSLLTCQAGGSLLPPGCRMHGGSQGDRQRGIYTSKLRDYGLGMGQTDVSVHIVDVDAQEIGG